jgi:hypothetical protein
MINTVFKKQSMHFFVLIFISIAVVSVASFFYNKYFDSSLPIYDGVMYEKQQVLRFLAFKGNYSFIERYNQFVYELVGNPVGGGFTALTCLINPKWLDSGFNISVRSFIVLLFFLFGLYKFLWVYLKSFGAWLMLIVVSQFPLFYHYRFGLASYVPDLPAGLSLCAAFLFAWLVSYRKVHFFYLYPVPVLISIAVFSRYNFLVYSFLLFIPMIIPLLRCFATLDRNWKFWMFVGYVLGFFLLWISYGLLHFDFFISYYAKPAEYQHVDYQTSFVSLSDYFKNELGLYFITWILVIGLGSKALNNPVDISKSKEKSLFWLNYPFVILFVFLFLILKATNQPHVFAAFFVFFIPFLLTVLLKLNFNFKIPNSIYLLPLAVSILIYWNIANQMHQIRNKEITVNSNFTLANYLMEHIRPGEKYFLMHDAMLEIPIDVYIYRNKGYWLDNNLMFYFTDWNFYDVSEKLSVKEITDYYKERILKEEVKFITIPKKPLKNEIANNVLIILKSWIVQNNFKKLKKNIKRDFELYEKSS